ncbi:MAG TPA: hypothetical protein VHB79_00550 [Polyangiaceae bacterium]|nr:hypothetical protein [Polyangiaceae bacterium]
MPSKHRSALALGVWLALSFGPACSATPPSSGSNGGSASLGVGGHGGTNGGTTASAAGSAGSPSLAGETNGGNGDAGSSAGTTAVGGGAAANGGAISGGTAGTGSGDFCAQRSGLAFCETFEGASVGPATAQPPWAPMVNGDGTVEIDGSVAHSGGHSLKVHGSGFSSFLVLSLAGLPMPAPTPLHVRAYVRLNEAMTAGHNTLLIADTQAAPGTGNAFRLGEMNEMLMYTVSGDAHGALANESYYTDHLPGAALQAQQWGCLEILLDHTKPEISVRLDDTEIADLHHSDYALDEYDALRFGFEKYAGPPSDLWFDDIAIGSAPIGCR